MIKEIKKNVFKGVVTSIIGLIVIGLTIFLLYNGSINFVYNGLAGLFFGTILLIAPDTIVKIVINVVKIGADKYRVNGKVDDDDDDDEEKSIKDEPK